MDTTLYSLQRQRLVTEDLHLHVLQHGIGPKGKNPGNYGLEATTFLGREEFEKEISTHYIMT